MEVPFEYAQAALVALEWQYDELDEACYDSEEEKEEYRKEVWAAMEFFRGVVATAEFEKMRAGEM